MRLHRTAEKIIQNDSARRKFKKFVYISKLYKNLKKGKRNGCAESSAQCTNIKSIKCAWKDVQTSINFFRNGNHWFE